MSMRLLRLALVALLSFALGYGWCSQRSRPPVEIAARVNGDPIFAKELSAELQKRFGGDVLRDLVHQRLILQEVQRRQLKIEPALFEKRLQQMKAQPQVQAMLKSGQVEEADLRRNLSTLIPLEQLVATSLTIDEEANYLEQHRADLESLKLRHILLKDEAEAQKVLEEARRPGADFLALARQYSRDERTKAQGGQLGEVHRAELDPEVADALFQLQAGEVSEPLQSPDGIHLFQVVARKTSLEELRPQIREQLVASRRGEFVEELRSAAKIEVLPPYTLPETQAEPESEH